MKAAKPPGSPNRLRQIREALLIGKTALARKAGVSRLTIDRIEKGLPCRLDTQRKIVNALGLRLTESHRVFPRSEEIPREDPGQR